MCNVQQLDMLAPAVQCQTIMIMPMMGNFDDAEDDDDIYNAQQCQCLYIGGRSPIMLRVRPSRYSLSGDKGQSLH